MSERVLWIDGDWVGWDEAVIPILAHSTQRGSLVFDYISVNQTDTGPAIFRLHDHIDRFLRSCELGGLPIQHTKEELVDATIKTTAKNGGATAIKISAYIPSIEVDIVPQDNTVTVAIAAYEVGEDIIKKNKGTYHSSRRLKLMIERDKRNRRADIIPPQAKIAANYASPMAAKLKARKEGFDDILLMDDSGHIAEAPTANIFIVDTNGTLKTSPKDMVLWGITRSTVLTLAAAEGITCQEVPLRQEDLFEANEAFLSVTTIGVWPIETIDRRQIGSFSERPISTKLATRFADVVSGKDPEFAHWLQHV